MEGLDACECPVCFLVLSEGRPPMSMPCGHTLCKVGVALEGGRGTLSSLLLPLPPLIILVREEDSGHNAD